MRKNAEERLDSPQKELTTCDIPTPDHLTTAPTTISPPSQHRNPTNDEERGVCEAIAGREFAGDSCKDELAVNKVYHTSIAQYTYLSDSSIRWSCYI